MLRFIREIIADGLMEPKAILEMDKAIQAEMEAGVAYALTSSYPAAERALDLVFA